MLRETLRERGTTRGDNDFNGTLYSSSNAKQVKLTFLDRADNSENKESFHNGHTQTFTKYTNEL